VYVHTSLWRTGSQSPSLELPERTRLMYTSQQNALLRSTSLSGGVSGVRLVSVAPVTAMVGNGQKCCDASAVLSWQITCFTSKSSCHGTCKAFCRIMATTVLTSTVPSIAKPIGSCTNLILSDLHSKFHVCLRQTTT
jgi:hypothetical protein